MVLIKALTSVQLAMSFSSPSRNRFDLVWCGLTAVAFIGVNQLIAVASSTEKVNHPSFEQLSASKRTTLKSGEVLLSGEDGQFTARVLINAPVATTWEVLTDYDNFEAFFPNVENSRLLESNGNNSVFEQINVTNILFIKNRSRVVLETTETYPEQIKFHLVEGEVETLNGIWQLNPINSQIPEQSNSVLVTHQVTIDPKAGGLGRDLFFSTYRSILKDTLSAIKQETEERATD